MAGCKPSDPGYIYIIRSSNGLHKIGLAADVAQRFARLQSEHKGETLEIVRTIEAFNMAVVEDRFHAMFAARRVRGEWFRLEDDDWRRVDLLEQNTKELNKLLWPAEPGKGNTDNGTTYS